MEYWLRRGDSEYSFDVPEEASSREIVPDLKKSQEIDSKVGEARDALTNGCYVIVDYFPLHRLYADFLNWLLSGKDCEVYLSCWRCGEGLEGSYIENLKSAGLRVDVKPITAAKREEMVKRGVAYVYPLIPSVLACRVDEMLSYASYDELRIESTSDVVAIGLAPSPNQELLDVSIDGRVSTDIYLADIGERAECVVVSAGGYPLDVNLYLSLQPAMLASYAVREGGIIILVAECNEGIGSRSLVKLFYQSADQGWRLGDRGLIAKLAERIDQVKKRAKICLVSVLPKTYAEVIFGLRLFDTIQDALQYAVRSRGRGLSLYSIPHGHFTAPVIRE